MNRWQGLHYNKSQVFKCFSGLQEKVVQFDEDFFVSLRLRQGLSKRVQKNSRLKGTTSESLRDEFRFRARTAADQWSGDSRRFNKSTYILF